jgi:hypothetical protein
MSDKFLHSSSLGRKIRLALKPQNQERALDLDSAKRPDKSDSCDSD